MKLVTQTLGAICDSGGGFVRTGPFGSQLHQSDYQDEGVPVVMPKDLVGDRISLESISRISEQMATKLGKHKLEVGDIVYGRRGDIGRHALITAQERGWLCGTGSIRINLGSSEVEPAFLHYYFCDPQVVRWIYNQAIGATMPNLNSTILRSIPITYPPLPTQRKIADILSAYDDLIENNARRIKILEEMAQTIYREWFVHFRYPGHEQLEMVETELGMVPEGWEIKQLGDFAQEMRRSVQPNQVDPDTPYLGLEHFPRKSIALSEWGAARDVVSTKLAFKEGEILFGKIRPYFHKVGVAPVDGVCSSDTIVIAPRQPEFFGLTLACVSSTDFVDYATLTSKGTKMPRADWSVLTKYPLAKPPSDLLSKFDHVVRDYVALIQSLMFRNRNLRHTRDLLLPKLVSGEVKIQNTTERRQFEGL